MRLVEATPILVPMTARTETSASSLCMFWWMRLPAKRVSAWSVAATSASACSAPPASIAKATASAASARARVVSIIVPPRS